MRNFRVNFWLAVLDAIDATGRVTDGALRRAYNWVLERASDAEWRRP